MGSTPRYWTRFSMPPRRPPHSSGGLPSSWTAAGEPGQATLPRTGTPAANGVAPRCEAPPALLELRTNARVLVVTRGGECIALLPGRRLTAPGGRGAALTLSTSSVTNLVRRNGEGG